MKFANSYRTRCSICQLACWDKDPAKFGERAVGCIDSAFVFSLSSLPEDEVVLRVQKFERGCLCPTRYLNIRNLGCFRLFVKFRLEGPGCSAYGIAKTKVNAITFRSLVVTTKISRLEPTGSTSEERK